MRIAIISDIHANLEALQKAFEIIDKKNIDEIVCLGDVVGYGADPNQCIELVRERTKYVLLGNHDEAAIDLSLTLSFNQYARRAAHWTNENLTEANVEFLRALPLRLDLWDLTFVHSTPRNTEQWDYIFSAFEAEKYFDAFSTKICFIGHSHVPGIYCEDGTTYTVKSNLRYIINVGSIGQPRDGDARLSFGIMDTEKWEYEHIRSEYENYSAAAKIMQSGLPRYLAERLLVGM
jgi:predicted phosphodiesterase